MHRIQARLLAWALICLVLPGSSVQAEAFVWCTAPNGHAAIEYCTGSDCHAAQQPDAVASPGLADLSHVASGADVPKCSDERLFNPASGPKRTKGQIASQRVSPDLAAALLYPTAQDPSRLSTRRGLRPTSLAERPDPRLRAHRVTVLRL
jgi:hypothetical protein